MVGEGKSFFSGWGHLDNTQGGGGVVILSSVTGTANVKPSLPVPVR